MEDRERDKPSPITEGLLPAREREVRPAIRSCSMKGFELRAIPNGYHSLAGWKSLNLVSGAHPRPRISYFPSFAFASLKPSLTAFSLTGFVSIS